MAVCCMLILSGKFVHWTNSLLVYENRYSQSECADIWGRDVCPCQVARRTNWHHQLHGDKPWWTVSYFRLVWQHNHGINTKIALFPSIMRCSLYVHEFDVMQFNVLNVVWCVTILLTIKIKQIAVNLVHLVLWLNENSSNLHLLFQKVCIKSKEEKKKKKMKLSYYSTKKTIQSITIYS